VSEKKGDLRRPDPDDDIDDSDTDAAEQESIDFGDDVGEEVIDDDEELVDEP